jgi:hypothetical protein
MEKWEDWIWDTPIADRPTKVIQEKLEYIPEILTDLKRLDIEEAQQLKRRLMDQEIQGSEELARRKAERERKAEEERERKH